MSRPTVAVIGAGISGLTMSKMLADYGLEFATFESSDRVGGNWAFGNPNGHSSAYRSLHIDTSKHQLSFKDFPMPEEYPDFPHHTQIKDYLESYAEAFDLKRNIEFRNGVEHARRLLSTTDRSIADIGAGVGYQSASHFGRVFRQATGFTPTSVVSAGMSKFWYCVKHHAVETPPEGALRNRFHGDQQREGAVVLGREVPDVDRQQQEHVHRDENRKQSVPVEVDQQVLQRHGPAQVQKLGHDGQQKHQTLGVGDIDQATTNQ